MESRVKIANELHKKGYNCAQAVACASCDLVGVDEETMFKLSEGFGAGMGGMDGTCGAVSGAVLLAGMHNSNGKDLHNSKGATYQLSMAVRAAFSEKNSSVICRELKGVDTKKVLRSCDGCIEDAAAIAEKLLFEEI